jgi:hypothetical protein
MSELSHKRARSLIQQERLSPEKRSVLAQHLAWCEECRRYAETHVYLSQHLHLEPVRAQPAPEFRGAIFQRVQSQRRWNLIMNPVRASAAVAVLAAVVIVAWLAIRTTAGQSAVSQPATEAPQAVATGAPTRLPRPTLTPLPTRVQEILRQVTTPEELSGVWGFHSGPGFSEYWQFSQDGTFSRAASPTRERLENSPAVKGEFWFEGIRLYLNISENRSVRDRCLGDIGVYEVQLLQNGALRFELIEDECGSRSDALSHNDFEPTVLTQ